MRSNISGIRIGMIIWLLSFVLQANAFNAIESYQNQLQGRIKKGDTLIIKDEKFLNSAFDWTKIHNRTVNNVITFGLFRDSGYVFKKSFKCQVELKIEYWSQPDQADPVIVDHVKLDIGYDSIAGKPYQAAATYRFMNGYRVKITVNDITSAELGSSLPAAFSLAGQVVIERSYDIPEESTIVPIVRIGSGNTNANARSISMDTTRPDRVSLTWAKVTGAEEYDLEWTFIDELSNNGRTLAQQGTGITTTTLAAMFRSNATRVTVPHEYYDISLVSFTRYLLIRIRTVQYNTDGYRNTSLWSYDLDQSGNGTSGIGVITLDSTKAWHQPGMNWQYSAVYAEEGKKKEIVSYFDGSLRSRQTVTVNNSDQKAIVQESLYDEFGRPLASILPVPLSDDTLTYHPRLHLNSSLNTYSYTDVYGTGTDYINKPQPLSNTAGAARYYSANNVFLSDEQNKYIPDAGGYPFAVTLYTEDNTNRPRIQGGVGAIFQPGSDSLVSKATRYYYAKPEQWELDEMFGNDVGYATHYLKNMVVDGNGQVSLNYQNATGKTIATALAGKEPANLDPLISKPAPHSETFLILDPGRFTFDSSKLKLSATTTYMNPLRGKVKLSYNVNKLIFSYANVAIKICSNCYYDLKIRVTDDRNRSIYNTSIPVSGKVSDCMDTLAATGSVNVDFDQIGEYYITFELGLSEDALIAYTEDYVKKNTGLSTLYSFVRGAWNGAGGLACFDDCATCRTSLGTQAYYVDRVIKHFGEAGIDTVTNRSEIRNLSIAFYTVAYSMCLNARQTCLPAPCQDLENNMKLDLSPGGQYALFNDTLPLETGVNELYKHWRDIFPPKPNGDTNYIKEQFEINGVVTSPYDSSFTLGKLVTYWKSEWASRFLSYHPEYCALQFCNDNSSYIQWDQRLQKLGETTADISSLTVGNIAYDTAHAAWLVAGDPFFRSGGKGAAYAPAFTAQLNNYSSSVVGITSAPVKGLIAYIDYLLYCSDTTGNVNTSVNVNKWTNCIPNTACRIRDMEWSTYRDKYMELKQQYYQRYRDSAYCGSICPVGDPISYSISDCPSEESFSIKADTGVCASGTQRVKITYAGTTPLTKSTSIKLYYPSEYNSYTKDSTVVFALGQTDVLLNCMDKRINVSSMHIASVVCGTNVTPENFCSLYSNKESFSLTSFHDWSGGSDVNNKWIFTMRYIGTVPIPASVSLNVTVTFRHPLKFPNEFSGPFHFDQNTTSASVSLDGVGSTPYTYSMDSARFDCNVSTPPVPSCNPAYKYKTSRIDNISYTTPVLPTDTTALKAYAAAQIIAQVNANCEAQADTWMQLLNDGLPNDNTKRTLLRAKLIEICKLGGDVNHPNGASTTPTGKATAEGYKSFKDAIKGVLTLTAFSDTCNPWLLDAPYPYDVVEQSASHIIQRSNQSICDTLAVLTQAYTASGSSVTFYKYLTNKYGAAMTLTEAELAILQKGCVNCRYLLEKSIQVPVFLDGKAHGCITPQEFQNGITALQQETWLNSTSVNYEGIYSTYLNQRWGFTLSYSDYKDYADSLSVHPTNLLCNHPVYAAVKTDPYECLMTTLDDAIARGVYQYNDYIKEIRRVFRKDYIAYCSKVTPKLSMTANQQLYHFTLYYYDQAGNLVRTIPPEGVHLLDSSLVGQIDSARSNISKSCNYTGSATDTPKDSILNRLSTALDVTTNTSMEMWLYNAAVGSNQVLTSTGGKRYLINTCIGDHYLHFNTYTIVPGSDGTTVDFVLSSSTVADIQNGLPLRQWTHVVIQGAGLNTDNLSVYVNGKACPLAVNPPNEPCGWDIPTASGPLYPENLTTLKHLRLYNRVLKADEIAANAAESCMGLSPLVANNILFNPSLLYWARFNTPAAGSDGSTVETQFKPIFPSHTLPTSYAYHSLNGVETQSSPDNTGLSRFWYDKLGRVIYSQNSEQKTPVNGNISNRYSYTLYDGQGRINEVGEKAGVTSLSATPFLTPAAITSLGGDSSQITRTYYDELYAVGGVAQDNLRKRVSAVTYQETSTGLPQQATYYSYDQLGNVKTLWQQILDLGVKRIDYQYDLVSGKVNKVRYQQGAKDRFYYNYEYDAENRLIKAGSGINSISADAWEIENVKTDAAYRYYLHGPLARMELGNTALVQGLDYVYTLQGWLKGVNGNYLSAANDMGKDGVVGTPRAVVARDAYAYSLDYFNGDYQPIGASPTAFTLTWDTLQGDVMGRNLYNGNISRSTVALSNINAGASVGYTYRYDQLDRLTAMRQHTLSAGVTTWNTVSTGLPYKENVSYDGNGNILKYVRYGSGASGKGLPMDSLTYIYSRDASGNLTSNRLTQVQDSVTGDAYTNDLSNQLANNYLYDNIGNLIKDTSGGISNIQWNVYGKIKTITKADGSSLEYRYDISGNRIYKAYTHAGVTDKTWYVRDAQGNTLAVYGNKDGGSTLYWQEQQLYGNDRLGIWEPNIAVNTDANTAWDNVGLKRYELSNHLGNVLATISDKAILEGDHYKVELLSAQDYYPFGMLQPDRSYSLSSYRYGFNGKESDNEVKGDGNQYDYGFRLYDPRIGKFLSIDPLTKDYPWYTPYQFAGNKPIVAIDIDGLEELIVHQFFNAKNQITKITISRYTDVDDNLINNYIRCKDNNALITRKNVLVFNFKNGPSGGYDVSDQSELNKTQQSVLNKNMSVRSFSYENGGYESFSNDEYAGSRRKEGSLISSGGDITYPEPDHHHTEDVEAPSSYIMRMHPRGPDFSRKSTSENIPAFVSLINKEISAFKIKEKNVTGVKVSINLVTLPGNVALANEYKNQLSAIFPNAKIKVKPDKDYKPSSANGRQGSSEDINLNIRVSGKKKI
jgi:RHS repeat-associated protein